MVLLKKNNPPERISLVVCPEGFWLEGLSVVWLFWDLFVSGIWFSNDPSLPLSFWVFWKYKWSFPLKISNKIVKLWFKFITDELTTSHGHLIMNSNETNYFKPWCISTAAPNWFFPTASRKRSELWGHSQRSRLWYFNTDIRGWTRAAAVVGFSQRLQTKWNLS